MLGMIWTIENGLVRSGPRSEILEAVLERLEAADPGGNGRPDPLGLSGDVDPAVRLGHPRGGSAICEKRSMRRACLRSIHVVGSNPSARTRSARRSRWCRSA